MNEHEIETNSLTQFEHRSDEELRAIRSQIEAELTKREAQRDNKAWEEIERIASRRGFAVEKKRPRGRPRKKAKK